MKNVSVICVNMHSYICACIDLCVSKYICICVYMCVCVYMEMYIQRKRESEGGRKEGEGEETNARERQIQKINTRMHTQIC